MDYKELADRLEKRYKANETGSTFVTLCSRRDVLNAATAITDLLARTEAAESRAEKAERERDAAISVLQNLRDSALTAISEYEKNQKQKYGKKED